MGHRYRTTAFEAARARWGKDYMKRLADASGLSIYTLYQIRNETRGVGQGSIEGIMRAFPDLPFERLFVAADGATAQPKDANGKTLLRPTGADETRAVA